MLNLKRKFNRIGDFMTTPKWMLGLMCGVALFLCTCEDEHGSNNNENPPQAAVIADEE